MTTQDLLVLFFIMIISFIISAAIMIGVTTVAWSAMTYFRVRGKLKVGYGNDICKIVISRYFIRYNVRVIITRDGRNSTICSVSGCDLDNVLNELSHTLSINTIEASLRYISDKEHIKNTHPKLMLAMNDVLRGVIS